MASAPSAAAQRPSSGRVIPQIFTRVRGIDPSCDTVVVSLAGQPSCLPERLSGIPQMSLPADLPSP
jgi:hypothetical protein